MIRYVTLEEFKKTGVISKSDLKEYVSVSYESYITSPELLYEKVKVLYDFFDKRWLVNKSEGRK